MKIGLDVIVKNYLYLLVKEEVTIFRNPNVINASAAITQVIFIL